MVAKLDIFLRLTIMHLPRKGGSRRSSVVPLRSGTTGSDRRRTSMALYFTNTIRVKPGHLEEYMASAAKTIPIYEKHGVKFLGAFQAMGGDGNSAVYLVSVPNFAAWEGLVRSEEHTSELQSQS